MQNSITWKWLTITLYISVCVTIASQYTMSPILYSNMTRQSLNRNTWSVEKATWNTLNNIILILLYQIYMIVIL